MRKGDLIFYANIPTFGSWLQRVVTNTIYSHVSIALGILIYDWLGELEADIKVRIHSFHKRQVNMDVLKLEASEWAKSMALKETINVYESTLYGFIQWLTIAIRFGIEWVFRIIGKDASEVKKWNILWGWGVVCSELAYYYLKAVAKYVAIEYRLDLNKDEGLVKDEPRPTPSAIYQWSRLNTELDEYNPNLFTPKDIDDLSKLFTIIMKWDIA